MDRKFPTDRAHIVNTKNGQEKMAPVLLIFLIVTALGLSLLLLLFPWWYALAFLAVGAVAVLTWFNPEAGLLLLIITIPLNIYTTLLMGQLFSGFAATGVKLLGLVVVFSWLARVLVTREKIIGMKTGGAYGLLFLVIVTLSLLMAKGTAWEVSKLLTYLQLVALFFLCANLVTTPKMLKRILWFFLIAAAISSLLALLQHQKILSMKGTLATWEESIRVTGGVDNPNYFTVSLNVAFFISIGIFLQEKSFFKKTVLVAIAIFLIVAFVFTFSRGGAVAFVATFAYMIVRQRRRVGFLVAILILIALLIPFIPEDYIQRLSPAYAIKDPSVLSRLYAWKAALIMWSKHPIIGIGAGSFLRLVPEYLPIGYAKHMVTHNSYFGILAELGTLGFVLFLALIFGAYRSIRSFPNTVMGKESDLRYICLGLELAFISFLVSSMFLNAEYLKELWLIFGLGAALREMSSRFVNKELPEKK